MILNGNLIERIDSNLPFDCLVLMRVRIHQIQIF
jgi:hypothetical protein